MNLDAKIPVADTYSYGTFCTLLLTDFQKRSLVVKTSPQLLVTASQQSLGGFSWLMVMVFAKDMHQRAGSTSI